MKQQQPQAAQRRRCPVPQSFQQTASSKTFEAVAKQEPLSQQHCQEEEQPPTRQQSPKQQLQEPVGSKKCKNPQAPHPLKTATNITNEIKE